MLTSVPVDLQPETRGLLSSPDGWLCWSRYPGNQPDAAEEGQA